MKNTLWYLCILVFGFGVAMLWSCEKDDICVDGNTPLLIVTFHNINDKEEKKQVEALSVRATGKTELMVASTTDSIAIPLNTAANTTSLDFAKHLGSTEAEKPEDIDVVVANYAVKDVYVSRACGYVANFENLEIPFSSGATEWIKEIEIINTTVDAKANTHVKIYH
ncbi:MAG: DUF6452 family protein [Flavobacteriaceae bacterium]|nr:DUF6452 family protein [Flavobacteriaceae bacterium]